MEVRLRQQPSGCIYWPLTLMTFGVFALLKSLGERHFIQQMNETDVVTRGGMRVQWVEFTSIERRRSKMRSASAGALSDEYLLKSPKGRVSLPLWRTENATEARGLPFSASAA
jgi:hypothetical protein